MSRPPRRRRAPWWIAAVMALVLAGPAGAGAHPHVHVVYSVVLPIEPDAIERLGFVFTFDESFTSLLQYLAGGSDPAAVSEAHARSLRQLPHEIEVVYDGEPILLDAPVELEATASGGQLTYRFMVPLRTPLRPPGTLDISVQDHGFFAAFTLRPGAPVEVRPSGGATAACARALTATGAPGPVRCRYTAESSTGGPAPGTP